MKIINHSKPMQPRIDRDCILDTEIGLAESEWTSEALLNLKVPKPVEEDYIRSLKGLSEDGGRFGACRTDKTFHCFGRLPAELRLKIWEFASSSHNKPRVHCVKEADVGHFWSNQPISPLLHTCLESRCCYVETTNTKFAFETYINFAIDIIYIADLVDREESHPRFLEYEYTVEIQNLATRKELFCEIPGSAPILKKHMNMRYKMPNWESMSVVFQDERTIEEVWTDVGLTFRNLTSRQKRQGRGVHAVMYARKYAKLLNTMLAGWDENAVAHKFVVPNVIQSAPS